MMKKRKFNVTATVFIVALSIISVIGLLKADPAHAIIGGNDASENYPWMSYIHIQRLQKNANDECGATQISPDIVVTAAHCIEDSTGYHPDWIDVSVGVKQIKPMPSNPIRATKWTDGGRIETGGDWGVIKLPKPNNLSEYPLLPVNDEDFDYSPEYRVLGWGYLDDATKEDPKTLQEADIPYTDNESSCQNRGFICAGTEKKSSCSGDSGGPLLVRDARHRWVLAGVVSGGDTHCGVAGGLSMYTSIGAWREELTEAINQLGGILPPSWQNNPAEKDIAHPVEDTKTPQKDPVKEGQKPKTPNEDNSQDNTIAKSASLKVHETVKVGEKVEITASGFPTDSGTHIKIDGKDIAPVDIAGSEGDDIVFSWTPSADQIGEKEIIAVTENQLVTSNIKVKVISDIKQQEPDKTSTDISNTINEPINKQEDIVLKNSSFEKNNSLQNTSLNAERQNDYVSQVERVPSVLIDNKPYRIGEIVNAKVTGFAPRTEIVFVLHSTPIEVGRTVADVNGVAQLRFTLPTGLENGDHELIVSDSIGHTASTKIQLIKVDDSGKLADTGTDSYVTVLGLALAMIIGASVIMRSYNFS